MIKAPLLSIEDLHIAAESGRTLLEGLSLQMRAGEFLAVVGESGSGKTMAARSILDLLPPGVRKTGGAIRFEGADLTTLSPAAMRAIRGDRIGMVFQEPMVSLNPALTIGAQLAEGLRLHRKPGREAIRRQCLDMLERVKIKDPVRCLSAFPHEFSGGMRQRIMLASAMLLKPRLLIADEPTTALDTLNQREVMDLMAAMAREDGVAVLLITHDLGVVARYAETVAVLEKGRLVESGPTRRVLGQSEHPYTQKLVASLPRRAPDRPTVPDDAPVLLSVDQACVDYPGRPGMLRAGPPIRVVKNVDLSVRAGEILAVIGTSGSGKSTLGRAVLGLRPLSAGRISFDGKDVASLSPGAAQLVFQDPYSSLDPRIRVGEIVGAPLRIVPGLTREDRRRRVEEVLAEVGLADFAGRFPHQMSGGQRQRVAIARAVVGRPRLVVADEPVSALDMTIQLQVLSLFQKLQRQYGFACLFITHDLMVVRQVADRMVVMTDGVIVEAGTVEAIFAEPRHDYTRALLAATPGFEAVELGDGQGTSDA